MGPGTPRSRDRPLKRPSPRVLLGSLLAVLSGLLIAPSFAPLDLDALVWVSLVPFLVALRRVGPGAAIWLGWLWCFVCSAQVADALPHAVQTYFLQPPLMSWAMAAAVWTGTGCLYYMAFAPIFCLLARGFYALLPWLAGAAFVSAELARGRLWNELGLFVANPWALLGYALPADGAVGQGASLGGIYLVSFVIVSANAGIATMLASGKTARERLVPATLGALPALAIGVFGALTLHGAHEPSPDEGIPVALIQADVAVDTSWRRDHYGKNLALYLELTHRTLAEARPAVVFWPESSMTFFIEKDEEYRRAIAAIIGPGDVQLVAGGPGVGADPDQFFNSVFVIAPDGSLGERYDKRFLVPFSEYFPLQVFDFVRRRFGRVRVYQRGERNRPLTTSAGLAGLLVCNEALFPEVAGRRVAEGASYLLSPSNDSWIPSEEWADRMFAFAAYRAVEQRRPLVRVSTSGPSGVVDAYGRTLVRSQPFSQRVVLARLPPAGPVSLYARVGDAFAVSCVLAVAAAILFGLARRPRAAPAS